MFVILFYEVCSFCMAGGILFLYVGLLFCLSGHGQLIKYFTLGIFQELLLSVNVIL